MALINFNENYTFTKSKTKSNGEITIEALSVPVCDILEKYKCNTHFTDDELVNAKNDFSLFLSYYTNNNKPIIALNEDDDLESLVEFIIKLCGPDVNLNWINTSNIKNMCDVFNGTNFIGDISKWNTSNVTNMSRMFMNCPFNGDIENWDTSNVTDMSFMFKNNPNFDKDLSRWNTSKLRTVRQMAENCPNFNKTSVFAWDIHRCKDLYTMYGSVCKTIK